MALDEDEVRMAHVIRGPSLLNIMFSQYDAGPDGEHERRVEFAVYLMLPGRSVEARLDTSITGSTRYLTGEPRSEWSWILRGRIVGVNIKGAWISNRSHNQAQYGRLLGQEFLLRYRPVDRQGMCYILPKNPTRDSLLLEILHGQQIDLTEWGNVVIL